MTFARATANRGYHPIVISGMTFIVFPESPIEVRIIDPAKECTRIGHAHGREQPYQTRRFNDICLHPGNSATR